MGAYCSNAGPLINTVAAPTSSAMGIYNLPAALWPPPAGVHQHHADHRLSRRRPPERRLSLGAAGRGRPRDTLGIDSITLRRRNLLKKSQFPVKTPTGSQYDSGDPATLLDTALKEADWDGFAARRRAAKKNGRLRGIGCALFIEPSGGVGKEEIRIEVGRDGRLALFSNAGPSGQGHETVFPALVADILGLPQDEIELRVNDNAAPPVGRHRQLRFALADHATARRLQEGAREIVRKAKELAVKELEAEERDIVFEKGAFRVGGTDLSMSLKS